MNNNYLGFLNNINSIKINKETTLGETIGNSDLKRNSGSELRFKDESVFKKYPQLEKFKGENETGLKEMLKGARKALLWIDVLTLVIDNIVVSFLYFQVILV